jgi:hypothetical protein
MESQAVLQRSLQTHLERVGGQLDGAELYAIVVIRDLDPVAFVRGALEFVHHIPEPLRHPWYRTFTRTLFFAGNPQTVAERFECSHLADGGEIGWFGPGEHDDYLGLRRMLRLLRGPGPPPNLPATFELTVPGAKPRASSAVLRIATDGVSTREYLVHVNHTVCEAALRGLLTPGDKLAVSHVDELDPAEDLDPERAHLRIAEDPRRSGRLRLYARLDA